MEADHRRRAKEIFADAIELQPAERAAYLDRACGTDADLRTEVDAWLASHEQAIDFLSSAASVPEKDITPAPLPMGTTSRMAAELSEGPGTRIGPYKLLQLIGEGGFGAVFMADQERPVHRRVAVKVIKPGMDTRQVIARFEAERQALAMMDHPNIARVFDAGATDAGRPYFVMELVRGTPLNEYCDKHQLSTGERLQLFISVCQAIQHAHTKGIIHRDLKPSNVLVTVSDGKPVPKVIDFGIAKATQSRLTEKTLFTQYKQLIGTPQYMSPEQAESDGVDIDTRSDVYSLGVLLYELLVGSTPLDATKLRSMAYGEMQRVIREVEAPRPSTRLSTLGNALPSVASRRKIEPAKLGELLRGELDWIVMKALEKDRTRRYETASGLARDIERYLADETVEACPPSFAYQLRKFVSRYRTPLRAGAAFAVLLIAATLLSTWQAVRARRAEGIARAAEKAAVEAKAALVIERDKAVAEKQRADEQAAIAYEINAFFNQDVFGLMGSTRPTPYGAQPKPDITLRQALDNAADHIAGRFPAQPSVEAAIRTTIGLEYLDLGEFEKAQVHLEIAERLYRTGTKEPDANSLTALSDLASVYSRLGHDDKAEPLFQQALNGLQKLEGGDSPDLLPIVLELSLLYARQKNFEKAEAFGQQLLASEQRLHGDRHPDTYWAIASIAHAFTEQGQYAKAEPMYHKLLQADRADLSENHPVRLGALEGLGAMYAKYGDFAKSEPLYQQSLEGRRKSVGDDNPGTHSALISLAAVRIAQEHWAEAEPLLVQMCEWFLAHPERAWTDSTWAFGQARGAIVLVCQKLNKPEKALEWERKLEPLVLQQLRLQMAQIASELDKKSEKDPEFPQRLARRAHGNAQLTRFDEAAADYARSTALDPSDHYSLYRYGCLLAYLGRTSEYTQLCKAMLSCFGDNEDRQIEERTAKTCLLLPGNAGGDPKVMLKMAERALSRMGDDTFLEPWFDLCKAMALYRLNDFSGCIEWGEKCHTTTELPACTVGADMIVAMAQYRSGHSEQAKATYERAAQFFGREIADVSSGYVGAAGIENWLISETLRREAVAVLALPKSRPSSGNEGGVGP